MARLSEEVKKAIAEVRPGLIATANRAGRPNVSAKASFRVLDDEHVVFNDVNSPRTVANLKENPQVAVIGLDPATRRGYRVWGKAEILASGPLFEQMKQEAAKRNMVLKHVVRVAVDEAVAF